ncbi:putative lipoprotein [Listeria phage LMTA-57]|uniref:Putative lipoprotein n=3 Tax=Pecentumvirus TaxID=1857844 RepID=A0A060ALW9_9CAUD|nr:putative lipoprotein [Listeria phage LMSP-25]YP_009616213.1 putative lipoprotein [Listeria phage LMTA-34]YP_009793434.1 putative lipoprotein [Listeria phage LMTA-57]AIA64453.1 putative lipoprotein [Listeria phage LMSP-25]AID17011.1 putative lipoprotein [Listeria phage LMTA-34]AID17585.1 putative lipoprotein [Listeria phage LMTA-57]
MLKNTNLANYKKVNTRFGNLSFDDKGISNDLTEEQQKELGKLRGFEYIKAEQKTKEEPKKEEPKKEEPKKEEPKKEEPKKEEPKKEESKKESTENELDSFLAKEPSIKELKEFASKKGIKIEKTKKNDIIEELKRG